jgi:putative ABC transport system permease protein
LSRLPANKVDIHRSLKEEGRASTGSAQHSLIRRSLVIGEFALSLILLTGAGLLVLTFVNLQRVELGFQPSNVLSLRYIRTSEDSTKFFAELLGRIRQLPGVKSAGVASSVPLAGQNDSSDFEILGRPGPRQGELWIAGIATASSSYFETMGIPLLKGRQFTEEDDLGEHDRVAIINEAMVRRFFPDSDPIGQRLSISGGTRIIGVVGNIRHTAVEMPDVPEIYMPYQFASRRLTMVVRSDSDPRPLIGAIRAETARIDRNQSIFAITTMDQLVADALATRRYAMALVSIFAGFALVLATIGIYGVTAYSMVQRTGEIGIRMALGAAPGDIRRMVVSESSRLIGVGIAIGLAGSIGLTRFLGSLLYGVRPADPAVLTAVVAVLAGFGLIAALRPAIRAGNVDPLSAIRQL